MEQPDRFRANPRAGRKAGAFAAVLAGLVLLLLACLHFPGWQTRLTVPVISHTVYARELLDSTLFRVGADSVMELYLEHDLDTIRPTDLFGTVEVSDTFSLMLDSFVLTPVLDLETGAGMDDIIGAAPPDSALMPVPAFRCEIPVSGSLPGIEHAEPAGGFVIARVENRTRVRLDTVRLELGGIGTFNLGPLDSMCAAAQRMELAGATLGSVLNGSMVLTGPGTGAESVWVRATDSVLVRVVIDSMRLRRGRIRPGDSTRMTARYAKTSYLHTRHRMRLDTALFGSGTIDFRLHNTMPLPLSVELCVEELGFDSAIDLGPGQRTEFPLELTGRGYRNRSPDSSRLTVCCFARVKPTGSFVNLDPSHGLEIEFDGRTETPDYLEGEALDTVWNTELHDTVAIDFPEQLAHLKFAHVWLHGTAVNAVDFAGVLEMTVTAVNPEAESTIARNTVVVNPGTPGQPEASSASSDIAGLFNIAPDRLFISSRAGLIGPGRAWSGSWLTGDVILQTPLRAKLIADTFRFGPWEIPIDSTVRPNSKRELKGAELVVHVVNHLPLAMTGRLLLWSPTADTAAVPIAVPEAQIDPGSGRVVAARDSTVRAELNAEQCRVFYAESFQAELELFVPTTDTITLMARDYFRVEKSYARLTVEIPPK